MKLSYSKFGNAYSVESSDLSDSAVAYLVEYGWHQSLQDSIAGAPKRVLKDAVRKATSAGEVVTADQVVLAIRAEIDRLLSHRSKAIIEGTVGKRTQRAGEDEPVISEELLKEVAKLLSA